MSGPLIANRVNTMTSHEEGEARKESVETMASKQEERKERKEKKKDPMTNCLGKKTTQETRRQSAGSRFRSLSIANGQPGD